MVYSEQLIKEFLEGVRKAASAVISYNPKYHVVSLGGGLPLYEIAKVLNRDMPEVDNVFFFPGSSRIQNSSKVLERCFTNLILEKQAVSPNPSPITSLDEVVSGGSVERLKNAYETATMNVARINVGSPRTRDMVEAEKANVMTQFPLHVVGLKEIRDYDVHQKPKYKEDVKSGKVVEVPVKKIITMDEIDFERVRFQHPNSLGFNGQHFFPTIKEELVTSEYMNLLKAAAMYIGLDPSQIQLCPSARIAGDCQKYSRKIE